MRKIARQTLRSVVDTESPAQSGRNNGRNNNLHGRRLCTAQMHRPSAIGQAIALGESPRAAAALPPPKRTTPGNRCIGKSVARTIGARTSRGVRDPPEREARCLRRRADSHADTALQVPPRSRVRLEPTSTGASRRRCVFSSTRSLRTRITHTGHANTDFEPAFGYMAAFHIKLFARCCDS